MTNTPIAVLLCCAAIAHTSPLRSQTPTVRQATVVWQVDGSESGEPFGALRDYVLTKDGSVWALDFKDQVIRRYSAAGKALPTIGRKGSGPGEMRNANGLVVAPDGAVWVNDPANSRFTIFAPDGVLQRSVSVPITGYGYRWGAWFDPKGELVELHIGRETRDYRRIDRNGKVTGAVAAASCPSGKGVPAFIKAESPDGANRYMAYPFASGGGSVADRQGNFWCAATHGARVALIPAGQSDTLARTSFDITNVPVRPDERNAEVERVRKAIASYATNDFDIGKIPTSKPGIVTMFVDDDRRLWVVHQAPYQKTTSTYDVFDEKGRSLFRVILPVRTSVSLPIIARGNEFVVTTLDDDDVPSLTRYRLK